MPKKRRRPIESVHQKTQRALKDVRARGILGVLERSSETIVSDATPEETLKLNGDRPIRPIQEKPIIPTFNWKGNEGSPMFVPNLVSEGEMESLRREFINSVASGKSSSELDKRALRNPNQFREDTIEGIHRWHTYGKER